MNQKIIEQQNYWDKEIDNFDAIYSQKKSNLGKLLDKIFRWDMYERFNYTLKNSEPIQGRRFLDVGCGTGVYSLELARRGASQVVGIDISPNMIQVCQQRAEENSLVDRTMFLQTDLLEYPLDSKFDVCIGIGLFDYIKEPLPVIKKMRESVRDRAIMSFPRLWTWRAPLRKIRLGLRGCDVYFYTRTRIDQLLKQAGFNRYEIERVGKLYCVTAFVE